MSLRLFVLATLSAVAVGFVPTLNVRTPVSPIRVDGVKTASSRLPLAYPPLAPRKDISLYSTAAPAADAAPAKSESLKVGVYFMLWYILNIGYNIYNKKLLNALPLPWLMASVQLVVGIFYVLPLWILKIRKAPKVSVENVKKLSPVALMHTLAHITAVISLGAGAVSFTHIVKAGEPLFTSLLSAALLKEFFPLPVYATLIPVVVGVGLASLKELSFSWLSFGAAMGSNTASALRGIFSKKLMGKPQGENMDAANLYAVLTIIGSLMLVPVAAVLEGPKLASAVKAAVAGGVPEKTLAIYALLSGLFYYTYNEVAFLALDSVHPITHAVGNTVSTLKK